MTEQYNQQDINNSPVYETIHFDVGNVGPPALAPVPGTPNAAAMATFGQLNIYFDARIEVIHYHQIEDGAAGTSTIEIYRLRSGTFTLLGSMSLAFGGGNFGTAALVPAGDLRYLLGGDYIFCQATAFQTNGDGVTIDIHFTPNSINGFVP